MTEFTLLKAMWGLRDSFVSGLLENTNNIDYIICDLRLDIPAGLNILKNLDRSGSLSKCGESLVNECRKNPRDLILLKAISQRYFSSSLYTSFAKALSDYSRLDESIPLQVREELQLTPLIPTTVEAPRFDFLDTYSSEDFIRARKLLNRMRGPGEDFSIQSRDWIIPLEELDDLNFKSFLQIVLEKSSHNVINSFRERMQQVDDGAKAFLLVLVEPLNNYKKCYQFRSEIIEEGSAEPINFTDQRMVNGRYPTGTMGDFPRITGQWIKDAKLAYPNLFIEIFLPNDLLIESPSLMIELPVGERTKLVNLCYCGTPAVLRSLERAKAANKGQLASFLPKWNRLQPGQGKLRPIIHESQLQFEAFHSGLCNPDISGMLLLVNLPADYEERYTVFWEMIEVGIPICIWWRELNGDNADQAGEMPIQAKERLKNLKECLNLNEDPCIVDEAFQIPGTGIDNLHAPKHLHTMETTARKVCQLAGETRCLTWISSLMLLIDHPHRWPRCITDEAKPGGSLQSQI